ncbi:hypothetical protein JOE61_002334 [Nocardioides salarius]|uniref:Uncharacterized protein n=1 Tax=Nocardioides salarius TaxID=374513 RepID=A0ABS2MBI2_9ACTN|nr:hypothetical protein [Nocardioides salarius]MBM7508520.1 hypothetical protein [Nocardioides salarius]
MLESILAVGPLLAGLAAATGLILGLTKTVRLRRRESTLREAMTALDAGSKQYAILGDLHRAAVAELVGRQLTSAWRVAWPWLVWLTVIYFHIEPAKLAAEYLATEKDPSAAWRKSVEGSV